MPATRPVGARLERPLHVAPLGDPAGEQQRVVRRAAPPGRARAAPGRLVPRTCPPASTPWTITASAPAAWAARASATEPHWWIQVPAVRRFGAAPEGDDDVGARGGLEPVAAGEGQQQVDGERAVGQRPRRGQLALDRRRAVDRDRPQPAGLRDRRGELVAAQSRRPCRPGRPASRCRCSRGPPPGDLKMRRVSAFRIVVLASGQRHQPAGDPRPAARPRRVEVVGVGSDKPGARALERARGGRGRDRALPRRRATPTARRATPRSATGSRRAGADLVVLAGYMQLLSAAFVARFRHRVVNVHPALLPAFPGLDAIGQALEAGVETTGVTVHFVDEGVDTGPPILQREVAVPAEPRPGGARGGGPRARARALPGGDPHDRPGPG